MSILLSRNEEFRDEVDEMVRTGASYIDAIATWCADRGLEPEAGAELARQHPLIMQRLQMEAECLRALKRR